jgi:UDP-N-acetylglucosamine 2-epimerase (non-hydrolysing)
MNVLTIIGTRPEAVKMAPVLRALAARDGITSTIVSTGQHPDLLDEPLRFFGLKADLAFRLMEADGHPERLVARAVAALLPMLEQRRPDRVLVQGDTASALAGARAAMLAGIPFGHVEAGLRTHQHLPWPEESFRCEIDRIADLLFAPTPLAAANLRDETLRGSIYVTGNSGIDALRHVLVRIEEDAELRSACDALLPEPASGLPLALATLHRRESIGAGALELCAALLTLANEEAAEIAMPLHPNPAVSVPVRAVLDGHPRIHLLPPLNYPAMVRLMQQADWILTDSGGIQEEAPTLGKPVLVLRDATERPEAIALGLASLVGLDRHGIVAAARKILAEPRPAALASPYGDGHAAERIVAGLLGEAFQPFAEEPQPALKMVVGA